MDDQNQKGDPPKIDLIQMVQRARMQNDSGVQPSQAAAGYWVEAKRQPQHEGLPPTPRAGQWVVATTVQAIDALWTLVKQATEEGKLGYKAKASTLSRSGRNSPDRVICIRTYDADDAADVERVYQSLRELGITGEIVYERDHKAD